jgi:hypothetical protein
MRGKRINFAGDFPSEDALQAVKIKLNELRNWRGQVPHRHKTDDFVRTANKN